MVKDATQVRNCQCTKKCTQLGQIIPVKFVERFLSIDTVGKTILRHTQMRNAISAMSVENATTQVQFFALIESTVIMMGKNALYVIKLSLVAE